MLQMSTLELTLWGHADAGGVSSHGGPAAAIVALQPCAQPGAEPGTWASPAQDGGRWHAVGGNKQCAVH